MHSEISKQCCIGINCTIAKVEGRCPPLLEKCWQLPPLPLCIKNVNLAWLPNQIICSYIFFFFAAVTVLAQNTHIQQDTLTAFGSGGNSSYVDLPCTVEESTNLTSTCSLMNLNSSTNGTTIQITSIELVICLCGSAITVSYNLSDGSVISRFCQQCPFEVEIDRLRFYHNVSVSVNESGDTTIIMLSVSVCMHLV